MGVGECETPGRMANLGSRTTAVTCGIAEIDE